MQAAAFTQKQRMGSSSWLHEPAPHARAGWHVPPATATPRNHNLQLPPLAWQLCQALPPAGPAWRWGFSGRPPTAEGGGCWVSHLGTGDPHCSSSPGSRELAQHPHGMCLQGASPPPAPPDLPGPSLWQHVAHSTAAASSATNPALGRDIQGPPRLRGASTAGMDRAPQAGTEEETPLGLGGPSGREGEQPPGQRDKHGSDGKGGMLKQGRGPDRRQAGGSC